MTNEDQVEDAKEVTLSITERAILCALIMEGDNFIGSQTIAQAAECAQDSVKVLIHHMRDKGIPIESGYGRGYRLNIDALLRFLSSGSAPWVDPTRRRRLSRMP